MALTLKEECPLANLSKYKVVMIGGPQGDGTKLVMFNNHLQTSRSSRVTRSTIVSRWVVTREPISSQHKTLSKRDRTCKFGPSLRYFVHKVDVCFSDIFFSLKLLLVGYETHNLV